MTAPAHPQRCKTCKHRVLVSTYIASENERCDIKDTRLTYEGKSLIKIVGCASHSSVQSRDHQIEILLDILSTATIQYATQDDADYVRKLRTTHQEAQR